MSFTRNTFLAAVVAVGTVTVSLSSAEACRGRGGYGGGYSGGYGGGYSAHRYTQPRYQTYPTYPQPQQVVRPIRPVQQISQPGLQQAPVQQQFAQPQQVTPQQVAQPRTAAPQQPVQQAAPGNAAQSALQALGGVTAPQNTAPQQVQTPAHVGNWTATLGNGASVRLSLQADGNFSWVATNKAGTASSFSGNYTVSNGSLSLNRSTDNQKLAGTMTVTNDSAFSFKVGGSNASLNFVRA